MKQSIVRKNIITNNWEHYIPKQNGIEAHWSPGLIGYHHIINDNKEELLPIRDNINNLISYSEITYNHILYTLQSIDTTNVKDIEHVFKSSMDHFGGKIDFVLHSIGMSPNVRKGIPYDDINYDNFLKTLDISALSFHKMLQTARKLDAINEWGSVVALSYVAAQRTLFGYNDMADAKSLLESIARSFGYIYGREKKIRINTISQSPTLTTAGSGVSGIDTLIDFTERMSPLGNADADDCAGYCITLFSDLTRKVTMQNLFHDGGFSSMGMSLKAITQYNKSFDE